MSYDGYAAALADPGLAAYIRGGSFDLSRVLDNQGAGLQVWNSTADTTATQTVTLPNGGTQSLTVVTHQFSPAIR